jgi:tripartite-type tricarboxylate transporter receptor subunit TctC
MLLPRRQFLQLAAAAAALPEFLSTAGAEAYPTRPVHIVAGYPAGGAPDIMARLIGEWLSERLGQQFIVDDRPGAASNFGTEMVAKAPPDGYTLLIAVSTNAVNASFYANLNFNFIRDFVAVGSIGATPFVMVFNPSFPAKTFPEFIAYAKANPGEINMASQGIGTTPHVCGELLMMMTGIDLVHVPYRGNLMPDLLAGQVQFYFSPMAQAIEYVNWPAPPSRGDHRYASRDATCPASESSCRVTRRVVGTVFTHPRTRRPRSSTNSMRRSPPLSPIPSSKRASWP